MGRLQNNLYILRQNLGPLIKILPVLKADAYGHGAVAVGRCLEGLPGVEGFAVASVPEGLELRRSGIKLPIILLEYFLTGQEKSIADYELTPIVACREAVDNLAMQAKKLQKQIDVQVRLDTGFGNMGVTVEELPELMKHIDDVQWLKCNGIFTHLYASYYREDELLGRQLSLFKRGLEIAEKMKVPLSGIHAASSPAILQYPETHYNLVRPGTLLYGLPSFESQRKSDYLPVMQLKSRISHIKNLQAGTSVAFYKGMENITLSTRMATVPLGSADAHHLSSLNNGYVLIRGRKAPIIGSSFMMHFMVDISHIPESIPGDEVVLFGEQGDESITVEELANKSCIGIINCEKVCFLSSRIPRFFRG